MTRPTRHRLRIAGLCLALATLAGAAEAACLSSGEARKRVAAGEAMRLGAVAGQVDGEVLDAKLCEGGGGLVWRVTVMRDGGEVVVVVVDAASGEILR